MSLILKTIILKNFRSISSIVIDTPPNLLLFVGKNNAGKSNILDFLNLISKGFIDYNVAIGSRHNIKSLIPRKSKEQISALFKFNVQDKFRAQILENLISKLRDEDRIPIYDSQFLRSITYEFKASENLREEQIYTGELSPTQSEVILASLRYQNNNAEIKTANLEDLMLKLSRGAYGTLEYAKSEFHNPSLNLGFQTINDGGSSKLVNTLIQLIRNIMINILWISPIRKSNATTSVQGQFELDDEAHNLADVLHTIYTNKADVFKEIESEIRKLIPRVGSFHPIMEGQSTTILINDSKNPALSYRLDEMSFGTRTALAIITKILNAGENSWICIEEPETHLHPEAQANLADFLLRKSTTKRIFITTHSPVLASCIPLDSVKLILRNEQDDTLLENVSEENVKHVIHELGIRPSYNFEANKIIFVEGHDDIPLYLEWAKGYGLGPDIQFIAAEGWQSMDYFANAKVIANRNLEIEVYIIFDGDTDRQEKHRKIKQRLITDLHVPEDNMITMNQSEIEGYLLDCKAIEKAFPNLTLSTTELEKRITEGATKRNQKGILDKILMDGNIGRYNSSNGVIIASMMSDIPQGIKEIFDKIK